MRGAVLVAHRYYQQKGDDALYYADRLAREIERRGLLAEGRRQELQAFVTEQQQTLHLDGLEVVSPAGPLAKARGPQLATRRMPVLRPDLRAAFAQGQEFARTNKLGRVTTSTGALQLFSQSSVKFDGDGASS